MHLEEKKVAILGLGIEGLALYEYLRDKVTSLTVFDKQSQKQLLEKADETLKPKIEEVLADLAVEKCFGENYLINLAGFDIIFRSPSIYFQSPELILAKKQGAAISSQIKLFFDLCPCPIVGVTGTKGKGTTASLISEILKKNYQLPISDNQSNSKVQIQNEPNVYLAGNIGYPAITLIPKLQKYDVVILELSNFQLADLDKSPHIAVVTNLGVDHLDYHKDVAEYQETKKNIVRHQSCDDFAILNYNSTFSPEYISQLKSKIFYFSKDNPFVDGLISEGESGKTVFIKSNGRELEICSENEIKLVGRHNLENIAAAALAAFNLGVDIETIRKTVREFVGLPHRLEPVRTVGGVLFVNDSFATNPDPTIAAIESFAGEKVLILGGSPKGADFTALANTITKAKVRSVITIGVEGPKIRKALKNAGFGGKLLAGKNEIDGIVLQAKNEAVKGDTVIFSPACASFDMFENYKVRGEKFKTAVLNLE